MAWWVQGGLPVPHGPPWAGSGQRRGCQVSVVGGSGRHGCSAAGPTSYDKVRPKTKSSLVGVMSAAMSFSDHGGGLVMSVGVHCACTSPTPHVAYSHSSRALFTASRHVNCVQHALFPSSLAPRLQPHHHPHRLRPPPLPRPCAGDSGGGRAWL